MNYRFCKRKRLICFFVGLALAGIGVALSTRPGLGTSPISSPCYALTFLLPLSFGVWTVLFNLLLVGGQILILKKDFDWYQLTQIIAVCIFGFFIDFGMWLTQFICPANYLQCFAEQLLGCLVLAIGISLELIANVFYLPGEGFVKTIVERYKLNFGNTKICFDSALVLVAILISLAATGQLQGVREGTVLAAFTVGFFIRQFHRPFRNVKRLLIKA